MSQIRDKKAHKKRITTMNPINAKSVQLIELHAFCLLFVICFLIGITSLPQNQRDISISDLRTCVANITQTRK